MAASPTRRRWRWCGWTPSASSARALAGHVAGLDGILVPGRLRGPRHRGKDPGHPLRARGAGAVLRHLPGHAVRGDRVRAARVRARGRQLHRVRPRTRPQRRSTCCPSSAGSPTRAAPCGSASTRSRSSEGSAASRVYGAGADPGAPPPPLRGEQRLPAAAREGRAAHLRDLAEKQLVEIIELPDHPWFVAGQFHPEFRSRPWDPHPLFAAFIQAALDHQGGA